MGPLQHRVSYTSISDQNFVIDLRPSRHCRGLYCAHDLGQLDLEQVSSRYRSHLSKVAGGGRGEGILGRTPRTTGEEALAMQAA